MNRRVARAIHQSTNMTFWMENPDWNADMRAFRVGNRILRSLPFSIHQAQRRLFFDRERLLAVNGESVVAANGPDSVDKYMFRYPGNMPIETFKERVAYEVGAVTSCLAGVALPTEVSIKQATILKHAKPLATVTQTQQRLNLDVHRPMDLSMLNDEKNSPKKDRTVSDLEQMLGDIDVLSDSYGFYPDTAHSSGNLRHSILDGAVTLIDVMPVHSDGTRPIGDSPSNLLEHTTDSLQQYQAFVGQYGA